MKKLDRSITAFILFETDRCKDFYQFSLSHPEVLECHRLAGQYSYLIKISTYSMETLEDFVDEAIKYGKSSTHLIFSSASKKCFFQERRFNRLQRYLLSFSLIYERLAGKKLHQYRK
ncbi:Lrp/AsnC ligand binding domain-containing protein [Peribacillus frigoritolerans]|nr:Lrp/AsnC ligand binding domain-containing protein [Peribacillus frigoritolerans]